MVEPSQTGSMDTFLANRDLEGSVTFSEVDEGYMCQRDDQLTKLSMRKYRENSIWQLLTQLIYHKDSRNVLKFNPSEEIKKAFKEAGLPAPSAVPYMARRLYGCINCERYRHSSCPYHQRKIGPPTGICLLKRAWLSFVGTDDLKAWHPLPFPAWNERYLKNLTLMDGLYDRARADQLLAKIDDELAKGGPDTLNIRWEQLHRSAKNDWFEALKLVLPSETKQVDRETAKKFDITTSTLSVSDIQRLIKKVETGEVIDAEFETLDPEKHKKLMEED